MRKLSVLSKKEHEKRMKLYDQGLSDHVIAKYCGRAPSTICYWRNKNNLKPNDHRGRNKKLSNEEEKKRMDLYNRGLTDKKCGELLDIHPDSFTHWRIQKNLPKNLYKIKCKCGKIVETPCSTRKYCDNCIKIRNSIFYEVRSLRSKYAKLYVSSPKEAERIKNEIERLEGKEFKELAIDGIFEDFDIKKIKYK